MSGMAMRCGAGTLLVTGLSLLLTVAGDRSAGAAPATTLEVVGLRTEYKENPLGIDAPRPRLSWRLQSGQRGVVQSSYEIRVARPEGGLGSRGGRIWESGKVESDESTHRPYGGPPLESGHRYSWQVRVWDERGQPSEWSAPAWWEMGLLAPSDWTASWIEPDLPDDPSVSGPAPMLRREFEADGRIRRARAHVTAHGLYEIHLNGRRVGDQLFTPGWTAYRERLQYQTYDVTSLLKSGKNAVGVLLGNGWYRGDLPRRRNVYGERLGFSPRSRSPTRTGAPRSSARTAPGRPQPVPSSCRRSTTGKPTTPASRSPAGRRRASTTGSGPASGWSRAARTISWPRPVRRSGASKS